MWGVPVGIMRPSAPKDPWPDPPDLPRVSDELLEIRRRRYQEARAAGLSIAESELFASSETETGELRQLVKAGCPPDLIARILI